MNKLTLITASMCIAIVTSTNFAASEFNASRATNTVTQNTDKPVNIMCPIGKEAIVDGVPTLDYKGNTIAFCCPGCSSEFMDWDEASRDSFVANAKLGIYEVDASTTKATQNVEKPAVVTVAYPFNTCPISGGELGGMGDPIVKVYDGREVKFCCQMCVPTFEKDLRASFKELDLRIIAAQLPFYPATTCLVSDEPLAGEDADEPINFVYNNRLVQLCCKMCISKFKKSPSAYIAKLDQLVIEQQSEQYPLNTCPISGEPLGSMGDPIQVVHQGRLVKFCCSMCISQFEKNPLPTIEKIDAAWKAKHDG